MDHELLRYLYHAGAESETLYTRDKTISPSDKGYPGCEAGLAESGLLTEKRPGSRRGATPASPAGTCCIGGWVCI